MKQPLHPLSLISPPGPAALRLQGPPPGKAGKRKITSLLFLCLCFFLLPGLGWAQALKTIKGAVIGAADKAPLPGVTITIKGGSNGTVSAVDGTYSLQAKSTDVLVYSFIGFKNQEVTVGNQTTINVSLSEDASELNEVVVIGYGSVQKMDLTGAVSQPKMEELAKAPVSSFAEALAGRVAGVQVSSLDGQPGGTMNIVIRGAGSLTQDTSPLYVIDGFPVEDIDPATLNPEDIESMSILKDASSTAIYGSRAANGVVLIQTKRGKVGKPVLTYTTSLGFQDVRKTIELMSPYEFVKYNTELSPTTASIASYLAGDKTLESYRNVKGVDWQDYVFRTGQVAIHNLALRGGTEQTRYAISGSLFDQKGVVINTGMKRYTARVTIDQTISPRVKFGMTGNFSGVNSFGQVLRNGATASVSSTVMFRTWIYRPVTPAMGVEELVEEEADEGAITPSDIRINPFVDLQNQHQKNLNNQLDGNAFLTFDLGKGLNFKVTGGVRSNTFRYDRFFNSKTSQGSLSNPGNVNGINGSVSYVNQNSWSNEYILNYKKTFQKKHTITGLALSGLNQYRTSSHGYGGRMLPNESLGIEGLDEGIAYNPNSTSSVSTLASFATRWDYNYMSKYILTANLRADGSSKFINNKWGIFPGAAVAWNMTREEFFKDVLPAVSNSKLRFSYGSNGNNRVGDFSSRASLQQSLDGYSFMNATPTGAVFINNVGNPDLRWEKTTQLDLGYEVGLFKNRLELNVDLYRKTTNDLLLSALLPGSTGFTSAFKNIGKLKNEGLEFTVNTVNVDNGVFSWNSNFNISFNRNTVLALTQGQQSLGTVAAFDVNFGTPLYLAEIGRPAGMMYGFIWEGNYQYADFDSPAPGVYVLKPSVPANGQPRAGILPGDIKYRDINGDGDVTDLDKTIIGRGQAIHTGGFSNNLAYRGLSLNVFFQWSYGNDVYNANRLSLEGNSNRRVLVNQFASYVNRWSPENQTNQNYRANGHGVIGRHSTRVVEDGSYVRLKTLALDYAIPKKYITKYISSLSLNVAAQNLWTLTKYSGLDPEANTRNPILSPGFDFSAYPQARTLVFGIKAAL